MNTIQSPSPQILTGSVALGPAKTQTISLEAMTSRSHRWLRVEEMGVSLWADPSADTAIASRAIPMGSYVNIRCRAYRQDLMLNYVPTWLIGPRLQEFGEYQNIASILSAGNFIGPMETYRWKFAKPFFLPPGSAFSTQMQRNANTQDLLSAQNINCYVTVRCTQMSEAEARAAMEKGRNGSGNPVPYMNAYAPLTFPNKSNNLDLANPFLVPLQVQRMTGRCVGTNTCQGQDTGNITTVKLSDTRVVICEPTPMVAIFSSSRMDWTFTRTLQPAEYISAELGTSNATQAAPQVAIIGYRNEVLS